MLWTPCFDIFDQIPKRCWNLTVSQDYGPASPPAPQDQIYWHGRRDYHTHRDYHGLRDYLVRVGHVALHVSISHCAKRARCRELNPTLLDCKNQSCIVSLGDPSNVHTGLEFYSNRSQSSVLASSSYNVGDYKSPYQISPGVGNTSHSREHGSDCCQSSYACLLC